MSQSLPSQAAPAASPDEVEPPPETWRVRLRRGAGVPRRLLAVLFLPDRAVPAVVGAGRFGAAAAAAVLAAAVLALVVGARLDVSAQVADGKAGGAEQAGPGGHSGPGGPGGPSGPTAMSDQELQEALDRALAVWRVKLGLGAGLGLPARLLLLTLAILVVGRYVGGRPTTRGAAAAAACAALPGAVKDLLGAGAAALRVRVPVAELGGLVAPGDLIPQGGVAAARFLAGVDPFLLWAVVLLGFGFSAAAQVSRRKSFVTVVVCFAAYLLLTRRGGA